MQTKIAINGFGRIGRAVFKLILKNHPNLKIVAINDLADSKTLAYLLKYDSVYGIYDKSVESNKSSLLVDGKNIKIIAEPDPEKLPWKQMGIDIVLECTGRFRKLEDAEKHIKAGAKKVIISAPGKSKQIPPFVLGVNEDKFDSKKYNVIDMASCTTNALAPVAKVLNENFRILNGFVTTIHSYTTSQKLLDLPHKDLRRGRAAALNIVPTTTGAAKTIGKVLPELNGKLCGISIRVPVPTVSIIDLVCKVEKSASPEQVNSAFKKASKTKNLKGILNIEDTPLVSSDYIGNTFSATVDSSFTETSNNLIKVLAWYDNEWAYACRLADFTSYVGKKL